MNQPLISIIIPVYNKANELENCLNSVINQSYPNLQILLINDGSTDNSGQICDAYRAIDKRIESHHQENKGISYTRNKGVDLAQGDYCMFVDGDDYVAEHYVYNLYETLKSTSVDLAACQYITTSKQTLKQAVKFDEFDKDIMVLSCEEMLCRMLYHEEAEISVCDKLFKTELFDELRFPVDEIYEDLYLVPKLVMKANKVAVHAYTDYFNYLSGDSIQRSAFNENKLSAVRFMKEISEDLVNENQPELKKATAYRYFDIVCELLFQIKGDEHPEVRKQLWNELLTVRAVVKQDRHPNASRARLGAYLTHLGYYLMRFVYRLHFRIKHG